jgi:hypothetical protein
LEKPHKIVIIVASTIDGFLDVLEFHVGRRVHFYIDRFCYCEILVRQTQKFSERSIYVCMYLYAILASRVTGLSKFAPFRQLLNLANLGWKLCT